MKKKVICGQGEFERIIGTAASWSQVWEVCDERGLSTEPYGSEGPDAFYVSARQRSGAHPYWPPQDAFATD